MGYDPIADLLTRIRNGARARLRYVDVPWSRMKEKLVQVLREQGFVDHYLVKEENKKGTMRVFLKYAAGRQPVLQEIKRMSKPGLRKYIPYGKIPRVMGGMGISIVSTSQGILEGAQAREKKVGGELLFIAW